MYATYATSFKSVGLNLNGLPTDANNQPILSAATVKPEDVHHVEIGVKAEPLRAVTLNVTGYDTNIKDFQTQVVSGAVGVLRGYLANTDKVRVRGLELDASAAVNRHLSTYAATAITDGRYVSFPNAPPPLEETGGPQFKDISGSLLPGISKTAVSVGAEYATNRTLLKRPGEFFGAFDMSYRSRFSSSPTESRYMFVDGYTPERTCRIPGGARMDAVDLVAQPARHPLLRSAHRPAGQHRPNRRPARRPADVRGHAALRDQGTLMKSRAHLARFRGEDFRNWIIHAA